MNGNFYRASLWLGVAFFATGCTEGKDARVGPLGAKVVALERQLEQLQLQIRKQSEGKTWEEMAYLTPDADGYAAVKMDLGYMTVSLANIAEYANGSKVSLTFGNLTSATVDGLKAKIEWGTVDEKGMPKNEEAKSREIKLTESMSPGVWSRSDVVLEGVPPKALGFVRVRDISHQGIRLRGQPK